MTKAASEKTDSKITTTATTINTEKIKQKYLHQDGKESK